ILLISIATIAGGLLKFQPFPDLDGDIAEARIILPPGSSLSHTEAVVEHIVASAQKLNQEWSAKNENGTPLVEHITSQFNASAYANESGPHIATVRLYLLGAEDR
ncbi:hypothetical protein AKJ18_28645, partial [Vibrio xuii]